MSAVIYVNAQDIDAPHDDCSSAALYQQADVISWDRTLQELSQKRQSSVVFRHPRKRPRTSSQTLATEHDVASVNALAAELSVLPAYNSAPLQYVDSRMNCPGKFVQFGLLHNFSTICSCGCDQCAGRLQSIQHPFTYTLSPAILICASNAIPVCSVTPPLMT